MGEPTPKPFVIDRWAVVEAYRRVKANQGAAGVDRQSLQDFEADLRGNLYKIWNRMSSGTYFPPPVKAVAIPKAAGGTRILGVPTVADRVAQTVAAMALEPRVEPVFHPDSYGYRPRRSAIDAVRVCRQRCWESDWVIDLDLKSFFDTLPHDRLLRAVARHLDHDQRWVLLYVQRWLVAPLHQPDGSLVERDRGSPQGCAISPVLANLFLHYAFDTWMDRTFPDIRFERYADDSSVHDGGGGVVPPVTCTAPGRTYADVTREVWTQIRPSGVVAGFASASGSRAASTEMRFRGGQPAAVTDSEGTRCSGGDAGRVVPDGGHVRGNRLGRQPPPGVPARPDRGVARAATAGARPGRVRGARPRVERGAGAGPGGAGAGRRTVGRASAGPRHRRRVPGVAEGVGPGAGAVPAGAGEKRQLRRVRVGGHAAARVPALAAAAPPVAAAGRAARGQPRPRASRRRPAVGGVAAARGVGRLPSGAAAPVLRVGPGHRVGVRPRLSDAGARVPGGDRADGGVLRPARVFGADDTEVLVGRLRPHLLAGSAGTTAGKAFTARMLVDQLELLNAQLRGYGKRLTELLGEHPDTEIFRSFPGLGPVTAAVLLAEMGEDRGRFPTPAVLLAEAGLSPVTRASGRTRQVRFRYTANSRMRHAVDWWAFTSTRECEWARRVYDDGRARGQGKYRALRGLGGRWMRILWRCWTDHVPYDPSRHSAATTEAVTA